jgi:hypothetical protein
MPLTPKTPSSAPSGRMTLSQSTPPVPSYKDVSDSGWFNYQRTYGQSFDGPPMSSIPRRR